jgi:WD40-like Beta Propeller Repeat
VRGTFVQKPSVILLLLFLTGAIRVQRARTQTPTETLLSTENAYNPIPSPDSRYIAYVRIGWGSSTDIVGFGRASLASDVVVIHANGSQAAKEPVARAFLSAWTPDSTDLVCYRDGEYSLVSPGGRHTTKGHLPAATNVIGNERVSYLPTIGTEIWSQQNGFHTVLQTPSGALAEHNGWLGSLVAPSPNGKYVAITGSWPQAHLWVYDRERKVWTDLGIAEIHPDPDWDYIKPSWNPWFADSSRLAYFTNKYSVLSLNAPDGKHSTDIKIGGPAGLATPSPDGRSIAYVTFEPCHRKGRPDLQFWGGTRVWVVALSGKSEPRPVTAKNLDETYDLRWLNNRTLVFDRIADVPFYRQSRIWKAEAPRGHVK